MVDSSYTWLLLVIDRSGSMDRIRLEAQNAVNGLLTEQRKQPGRCDVEIVKFASTVEVHAPLNDINRIEDFTLAPTTMTALYDGIGSTIKRAGERLAGLDEDERPGHVICAIVTDGQENHSEEFNLSQVKEMITHQREKYGWEFIFLAANQDAVLTGAEMGMPQRSSMSFMATGAGAQSAVASASAYVTTTRSGNIASFSDEDRDQAMEK